MTGRCLTIVPMKEPASSKTRLRDTLSLPARTSLARLLFHRTIDKLKQTQKLTAFDLAVVTGSADIAETATSVGIRVIPEPNVSGLSNAAATAQDWAEKAGYDLLCVVPADLAAPDVHDIARVIDTARTARCPVICPATDLGTNALVAPLPLRFRFAYGPLSARAHMENADSAGLNPILMPLESLRHDIDTAACLARAVRYAPDLPKDLCKI